LDRELRDDFSILLETCHFFFCCGRWTGLSNTSNHPRDFLLTIAIQHSLKAFASLSGEGRSIPRDCELGCAPLIESESVLKAWSQALEIASAVLKPVVNIVTKAQSPSVFSLDRILASASTNSRKNEENKQEVDMRLSSNTATHKG
jgi:hypothetical protein